MELGRSVSCVEEGMVASELYVHDSQAHQAAYGDFVFQGKGQMPHDCNGQQRADDVGKDRDS